MLQSKHLNLFRSVKFNIILFAVLASASALGTFLPQASDAPEKVQAFLATHTFLGPIFNFLGFFNLYYSFWFTGCLGLMAFDIVVCKLNKTPPDAGLSRLPPEFDPREKNTTDPEAMLRLKPYRSQWSLGKKRILAQPIRDFFKKWGYAWEESESFQGLQLWVGTRHRIQRWGSYISHVSLVVLLLGALIRGLFGFSEVVPVLEGRSRIMDHKPWEIYVDRFEVAYYPGTLNPSRFSSDLRVYERKGLKKGKNGEDWYEEDPFEEGRLLGQKKILVNDPLALPAGQGQLGKIKIYQASWGAGGMFRSVTLELGKHKVQAPQRTRVKIPGAPIELEADLMLPNFTVGKGNRADSESMDLKNPAVRLFFYHQGQKTVPLWLFKNWPELCFAEDENGVLHHAPTPPFRLAAIDPILFSGLQVGYDPGFPVVMTGALGLLLGLSALFYLHRRRVWVLVKKEGPHAQILVGGWSSRGPRDFQKEFDRLMEDLKARTGAISESAVVSNKQIEYDTIGG
ncbi:MAG: cytochrome c biogenesis protein ResB [Elusimicrobia bacterium]|nr:cytochrome c biogenesis protein ResB [Elusimicrobiota bacterium]